MTAFMDWRAGLDAIRRDNHSGATALLLRAANLLDAAAATVEAAGPAESSAWSRDRRGRG